VATVLPFENGDLVNGTPRAGQKEAPARAYGKLKIRGKTWRIGVWRVIPASVRHVAGADRPLVRIFEKTSGHCHFCGDPLDFEKRLRSKSLDAWEQDHVIPKYHGGERGVSNRLPAHWRCNGLRWHRGHEKLQTLLRLGLIAREQIKHGTKMGTRLESLLEKRKQSNQKRSG